MPSDAQYDILNVKNTLYANNIQTNTITLNDTTIRANIHTTGKRIKELYERQQNTNCYTDEDCTVVNNLKQLVESDYTPTTINPCFVKLIHHSEINDDTMPDNSYIMCLDDNNNAIHKIKTNGSINYGQVTEIEPYINVQITESNWSMNLSANPFQS
uniref:Uncharacterized protein n=1 Tax=viral metagenome TaxID=1070528 RepID=A0A6C0FBG7_9ZZZZ|tara:strand:- start:7507 stop:7977 length:471 start_codon:yes stop_codon:yes gene_type:complete